MNGFKRNLTLLFLIGTPLVCGVITAVKFQQNVTRQNRNRALIEAILSDKEAEAIRLLASGADANARQLPPDTRTFWQKVREIWRPVKRDETAYPSALTLALARDMVLDNLDALEADFPLIKTLHDGGAKEEGKSATWDGDLQKDIQAMKADTDSPLELASSALDLDDTNQRLETFLISYGMSARAMADLADCRFRAAKYTDAVYAYRIAALWQTPDAGLQTRLAQAEEYARASAEIGRTLSASQRVYRVCPYPSEAHPAAWIALYTSIEAYKTDDAQIGLYQSGGAGLRQICHTPVNGSTLHEYGLNYQGRLRLFPLTGRAAPEILLSSEASGDWGHRATLEVFSCAGGKFTNLASISGKISLALEKAPHGNGYIISRAYQMNEMYYDGEGPLRPDLYAFNGKRFALADAQYPETFREYIEEAEAMLHDHPTAYNLRQSLAYVYKITGRPQKSEQYYRKAERDCRAAIAQESKENAEDDRKILEQIVARNPERDF